MRIIGRRALAGALLFSFLLTSRASADDPVMPPPSYANTLYAFVYGPSLSTETAFLAAVNELVSRVTPGPYARVGFVDYFAVHMPWTADLANPILSAPSATSLSTLLSRLEAQGLTFHMSAMGGMSRAVYVYDIAKREDRRIAQWFSDGLIEAPGVPASSAVINAWVTPSRYARKLRRHMEAKVRAFAELFLTLQAQYPDTLISASGDAEAELSEGRVNTSLPRQSQILADYSPFTILEFRDWILHTGLYAPGGQYDGEGYRRKAAQTFEQGAGALSPENLATFNANFGTSLASWDLKYFNWSLADPIDGDPKAIKFRKYKKATFTPLPTSGPNYVAGGFDAPRAWNNPSRKLWKLWLKFRTAMIKHYGRDFATWMTTTPGPGGPLPKDRWYSHQIPADYLNETRPGSANPALRLFTSASPMGTAMIGEDVGSAGLTILDRFEFTGFGPQGGYYRTSKYLLPDIEALGMANWGIPEFAPSWHIDVAPDANVPRIAAQYHRAYQAGAHMFCYTPWPHFVATQNGVAMGSFIAQVRDQPRAPSYVPVELFARQLYLDLLGRQPNPLSELDPTMNAIKDGVLTRPQLVLDMLDSPEVQRGLDRIARYYLALLGRRPDFDGLLAWASYLLGCQSASCDLTRRQEIVDAFAATTEFQSLFPPSLTTRQLVNALFQAVLGRAPSAAERTEYVDAINFGGKTRAQMARKLADSDESILRYTQDVRVTLEYVALLGRVPSDSEFAAWSDELNAGLPRTAMAQVLITSPEYLARFP